MRMGQGVRTGLGHGGITCVLQTQFSSFYLKLLISQSKFSGTRKFTLRYQYLEMNFNFDLMFLGNTESL